MRVFAKFLNSDQPSNTQSIPFKRLALFCTPITAAFPAGADQGMHVALRGTGTKGLSKIRSLGCIQTAIPHAVSSDSTAVASRTERRGRRRDNPEGRSIRQSKSLRRRSPSFWYCLNRPVVLAQQGKHGGSGEDFVLRPLVRTTDVHIFDKPNLRLYPLAELDEIDQLIVIEIPDRHGIELQASESHPTHRLNPFYHARKLIPAGQLAKSCRPQRIEADRNAMQP